MRIVRCILAGVTLLSLSTTVLACPECRAKVEGGVYDKNFIANLFILLSPILILTAIGIGLYYTDEITKKLSGKISKWQTKENAVR